MVLCDSRFAVRCILSLSCLRWQLCFCAFVNLKWGGGVILSMRKFIIMIALAAASALTWSVLSSSKAPEVPPDVQQTLFERAVTLIKKYETLHQPRHWPLVGYGHLVLAGEKYSRTKALSEAEADALLRKDLLKNCAVFRDYGADSLLLGVLAYNIGSGNVKKSSVVRKLREGDRDIAASYLSHSRYRGRQHAGLRKRRADELGQLFVTDSLLQAFARENVEENVKENVKEAVPHDTLAADPDTLDNNLSNTATDE